MSTVPSTTSPGVAAAQSPLARAWGSHGRALLTLADQGVFSIASFATNFLLLHHFAKDVEHYAYYTLAFNLMIWMTEAHATLVFTPHTILAPRKRGPDLQRFYGSTLIHHFIVSVIAMIALAVAAMIVLPVDPTMGKVLLALSAGTIVIGLRNYARPFSFTARKPHVALLLDIAVAALQVGGILLLREMNELTSPRAVAIAAAAAALPAFVWLFAQRSQFIPSLGESVRQFRVEWPHTRWIFLSGLIWNSGMQLYPWLIAALAGKLEVAVWGACYQLAAVANPLLMGLQNFAGPRIAEAFTDRDRGAFRTYVYRMALGNLSLMIGPAIVLALVAHHALAWISRGEFTGHQGAITLLCAAFSLQAITFTLSRGLFAIHRADLDMYCNFGPLLLLFTAGTWLTWHFGADGAALSMLIAQVISSLSRAILFSRASRHDTTPAFDAELAPPADGASSRPTGGEA